MENKEMESKELVKNITNALQIFLDYIHIEIDNALTGLLDKDLDNKIYEILWVGMKEDIKDEIDTEIYLELHMLMWLDLDVEFDII